MGDSRPLGILDSGLGGLSVLLELRAQLPSEDLLYYGDSAHCPYGGRPLEFILDRSSTIADHLVERGAKLLIVACNTASTVALAHLRARHKVPIVGMVPAVKPAAAATRSGRIGVIATPRTVTGEALAGLIREHARGVEVYTTAGHGWVQLVEGGCVTGPEVTATLRRVVCPLVELGVDTLVLGCTHYPFLRTPLQSLVGPGVSLIDSGEAVARRTADVLLRRNLLTSRHVEGKLELLTSGDSEHVSEVASRLLGEPVRATTVAL
ncbi:MAG: glutamate racemase [Chloroflexota bacterium]|nr:glutamate racemase [Chloroflexota bacterium]